MLQSVELAKLLSLSNFDIAAITIVDVVEAAKSDKDGMISFEDFVSTVVNEAEQRQRTAYDLRCRFEAEKACNQLDTNGNGASASTHCTWL